MSNGQPEFESRFGRYLIEQMGGSTDLLSRRHAYPAWTQAEWRELPAHQDMLEYWRIFRLRKILILGFVLLGLLIALMFSLFQRPVYRAHTSVTIQDLNENFLNLKEDPTSRNAAGPTDSYFQTQVQILHSESLLGRVVDKPAIAQALTQQETKSRSLGWRKYLSFPKSPPRVDREQLIGQVASGLTVRSSSDTRLVDVYFEAADPQLAADFTNTLITEFVEQSHQMRWESTQGTAEWLAAHLSDMKLNFENAEAQLQAYARSSGLLFSGQGNVAEEKLRQIQGDYSKAQVERAEKQAKHESAITKPIESLPEALDDPTMREYGLRLSQPRLNIVGRTANEYQSARRREELLARAYRQQAQLVSKQAEKAIHYDTLKHEVDTSRQLYDTLLQRVKHAGVAAAMLASNLLVVDAAKPPLLHYRPNYPLNLAIGLLIGTFLGVGVSILRERFDQSIAAPAYLNLPELGAIPLAEISSASFVRGLFSTRNKLNVATLPLNGSRSGENHLCKASLNKGAAQSSELVMMAEAFRATLASILLPTFGTTPPPRVIVVTSPRPNAGKTTVTSNLGIVMAEMGRRVLLIDGDLRNPRLHDVFQMANNWGLCDVVRSNNPISNCGLLQIVRHTDVPGLDLLPSGSPRELPSHLLYSARIAELLQRLREEYDLVLVDSPPAMQFADARVLGRLADAVVLVIRSGQTTFGVAQMALQRFAEDHTRVLGTVLNSWDPRSSEGSDYTYSYREYVQRYTS